MIHLNRVLVVKLIFILLSLLGIGRSWSRALNPDADGFNPIQFHAMRYERWPIAIGKALRDVLPPHTRVAIYDWPGMTAYYSDLSIFPLDGLVADYEYSDSVAKIGIQKYLKDHAIGYYLGPQIVSDYQPNYLRSKNAVTPQGQTISVFAPKSKLYAGSFLIRNSDRIIDFDHVPSCLVSEHLGLWKIAR
jgi:hypothetical protein